MSRKQLSQLKNFKQKVNWINVDASAHKILQFFPTMNLLVRLIDWKWVLNSNAVHIHTFFYAYIYKPHAVNGALQLCWHNKAKQRYDKHDCECRKEREKANEKKMRNYCEQNITNIDRTCTVSAFSWYSLCSHWIPLNEQNETRIRIYKHKHNHEQTISENAVRLRFRFRFHFAHFFVSFACTPTSCCCCCCNYIHTKRHSQIC